jgi:hypothetical protein
MKRLVEGEDRRHGVLLPDYLDDFVAGHDDRWQTERLDSLRAWHRNYGTGSWAALNGKRYEWTAKGTGPNVMEGDYTFK